MKLQNKNQKTRENKTMRVFVNLLFVFLFINLSFLIVRAQPAGSLDTTFGTGGKVTTAFSTDFSFGFASAIQSDGRIVVAGAAQRTGSADRDFFVARYLPNGLLDNSFGKRGTATISFYNSEIEKSAGVVIQPDGKIVVLGETTAAGGTVDFAVMRLNRNGTPDISFGTEGKVIIDFSGTDDRASAVKIDSSSRIVVAGYKIVLPFNSEQTVLARLHPNGSLDTSFGTGGKLIPEINGTGNSAAYDILIQPVDDKIVVVGFVSAQSFIARFLPNGSFDTSFGSNGKRIAGYAGAAGFANAVALDPVSGGFVTVGPLTLAATGQRIFGLFRFTSNGNFDTSFGPEGDGAATLAFGTREDFPTGIAIEPDRKIVVGGWSRELSANTNFALARLSGSGFIDTTFGTSGKTIVPMRGGFANALNLQTDGKIIQTGYGGAPFPVNRGSMVVTRYNTDGILDASFDGDGIALTAVGSFDYAGKTVVQADGKIIVAGITDQSRTSLYSDFVLTRYNVNGTLDASFGTDGKVQTDFQDGYDGIRSLAIQADGKIVAGGYSSLGPKYDYALARYNTDGSLDASFGTGGKVIANFLSDSEFLVDLAIQSDGKIVAVGFDTNVIPSSESDFITIRIKPDGGIDSSFGTGGIVRTDLGISRGDYSNAVAVQPDGKIVVVGDAATIGGLSDFAAVRYETNGSLDTTFDGDGKLRILFDSVSSSANDVAIGTDGNLVLAGRAGLGNDIDFALVRIKNDGSLDAAFDVDGRATVAFDASFSGAGKIAAPSVISNDQAYAVAIQTDGKIVAAGNTGVGETSDFALARLNYDGSPDSSFDTDGKTTTSFGDDDFVSSVAIQSDGKIIVAGSTENFSDTDFAIARYNAFVPTASNASISGQVITADGRGISNAHLVLTDSSGASRYVSTGSFGYYRFDDLPTGATYVLAVSANRYVFAQPSRIVNLSEELIDVNFISEP